MNSILQSRKILCALGLGTAFSLLGDATLYAVLSTHTEEAGITLAAVGILLGVNRAIRLLSNGVAGWLYDQLSQRKLFVLGLGIGAFSTACYALSKGLWLLFFGRVVWGIAWSLIWVGGGTILLNISEESERGRLTGFYQTWFFLGAGTGAFLGGLLTDLIGYSSTLWILSAMQALSIGLVWCLLPSIPRNVHDPAFDPGSRSVRSLLSKDFGMTIALQGLNRFCISGVLMSTLGLVVKERVISPNMLIGAATLTGLLIAGRTVVSMAVAPLAGFLSDRWGTRWRVMTFSLFVGCFAMLFLSFSSASLIVAGVLGGAVIASAVQSLSITLTGDLVEAAHRGKALSILHTFGDLGSAIGPPCAYALLFRLGLNGMYLVCAGFFGLACVLVAIYKS